MVDVVRDGIRAGLGVLTGMQGSARAGSKARLQLTLTTSTLTRSAARRSRAHVDLRVGSRWALGVRHRHRQRGGTGRRGGQRGHGRWASGARGGGGGSHGERSGSRWTARGLQRTAYACRRRILILRGLACLTKTPHSRRPAPSRRGLIHPRACSS